MSYSIIYISRMYNTSLAAATGGTWIIDPRAGTPGRRDLNCAHKSLVIRSRFTAGTTSCPCTWAWVGARRLRTARPRGACAPCGPRAGPASPRAPEPACAREISPRPPWRLACSRPRCSSWGPLSASLWPGSACRCLRRLEMEIVRYL